MGKADSIVFFGTGPVALASITELAKHFPVEAVITKPDHQHHNNAFIEQSIKLWAKAQSVAYYQPANGGELEHLLKTESFDSRLGVVVDYGILIPKGVINSFELGIINSHFSLLPQMRGADPITAAILSGQSKTGVSLMLIVDKLDEGPLLAQTEYQLSPDVTVGQLTDALVNLSNQLLINTLPKYLKSDIKLWPQPGDKPPTYTHKLTKADGRIDWRQPPEQIERQVRAYLGWPGSYTQLGGKNVTITAARRHEDSGPPGDYFITPDKQLGVYAGNGSLVIDKLKPAGKQEISGSDFIRGYLRAG